MPTEEELKDAPLLDDWYLYPARPGALVVVATVSGHPRLPDGPVTTSRVTAYDEKAGWCQTLNRLYRLGKPYTKKQTYLDELIARGPVVFPDVDIEATKATWEDYRDRPKDDEEGATGRPFSCQQIADPLGKSNLPGLHGGPSHARFTNQSANISVGGPAGPRGAPPGARAFPLCGRHFRPVGRTSA
jgi:hypothetical protein